MKAQILCLDGEECQCGEYDEEECGVSDWQRKHCQKRKVSEVYRPKERQDCGQGADNSSRREAYRGNLPLLTCGP
jgi:hypothetical protein